jgi:hypothetical protein
MAKLLVKLTEYPLNPLFHLGALGTNLAFDRRNRLQLSAAPTTAVIGMWQRQLLIHGVSPAQASP